MKALQQKTRLTEDFMDIYKPIILFENDMYKNAYFMLNDKINNV